MLNLEFSAKLSGNSLSYSVAIDLVRRTAVFRQRNFLENNPNSDAGVEVIDELFIYSLIKLSGEKSMGSLKFLECSVSFDFLG